MSSFEQHSVDLRRAFANATLAAVHIDLAVGFFSPRTHMAFKAVNQFAQQMREKAIPNYWTMLTRRCHVGTVREYRTHDIIADRFHQTVQPEDNEVLLEKQGQSLFDGQGTIAQTLRADNIDTLLVTGVYHDMCVADTVRSALREHFRVYVVADATDCPMVNFEFMGRQILKHVEPGLHRQMDVTSTYLVAEALREMTRNAADFPPREQAAIALG